MVGEHDVVGVEEHGPRGLNASQSGIAGVGGAGARFGDYFHGEVGCGVGFGPTLEHGQGVVGGVVVDQHHR